MVPCFELLRRRRARQWTQAKAASLAGVNVATLVRLERGTYRRGPALETLTALASAFACEPAALFPELLAGAPGVGAGTVIELARASSAPVAEALA